MHIILKKHIENKYTVKAALLILRNLKCKVYEYELIVQELTKQQKDIFTHLNIIMPKNT